MRLKFLKLVDQHKPGDVAEVNDSLANKLIWRKLAEKAPDEPEPTPEPEVATIIVDEESTIEVATAEPEVEVAATRTDKLKRSTKK